MQLDQASDIKEVEAAINEFHRKLDRLKILYEQYFMGIEKREPLVPLKDVIRIMREIDNVQIRNTGLRFRYRSLVQKLNTYKTYWTRTMRAIENGTYHRDLARVRRSMARKGIAMPKAGKLRTVADVERAISEAAKEAEQRPGDDTDKHPAITDDLSPASIRGVPADQIRSQFEPEPGLGPIDLSDDEQTDQTHRNPAETMKPPQAQPPRPQSQPDLPRSPSQQQQRPQSQPDLPRSPSQQQQRPQSQPDLPRSPSQQQQRPQSQPDLPRSPSQQLQRPQSRPDLPRSPSQQMQRPPSRPDMPREQRPPSRPDMPREQRPRRAQQQGARPRQQPAGGRPSQGISEERMQSIYRRFVKAKRLCGEDTSSVRYESIANSISKQLPKIREQYGDRDVDFQVVIRAGRAVLKAKVK